MGAHLDWPKSVCVRLTRACNAGCEFCQAPHTDDKTLSMHDLVEICRALQGANVQSVKLSGGEPTIRNDLPEIVSLFGQAGFKVTVISNGIRVMDNLLKAMQTQKAKFKFSVHFPDKRNDRVLKNRAFSKIETNAHRIIAAHVPLSINCVVSVDNIHEMRGMVEMSRGWGCEKISFLPLVFRGAARAESFTTTMDSAIYKTCAETVSRLKLEYTDIRVNLIDIRAKPYWIIDNDNTLFISGDVEENDVVLGKTGAWVHEIGDSHAA